MHWGQNAILAGFTACIFFIQQLPTIAQPGPPEPLTVLGTTFTVTPIASAAGFGRPWAELKQFVPAEVLQAPPKPLSREQVLDRVQALLAERGKQYDAALSQITDRHLQEFLRETPQANWDWFNLALAGDCLASVANKYIPGDVRRLCEEYQALDLVFTMLQRAPAPVLASTAAPAPTTPECKRLIEQTRSAMNSLKVMPPGSSFKSGDLISFSWQIGTSRPPLPANLAIEVPAETRFNGKDAVTAIVKSEKPRFGLIGDGREVAGVVPLDRMQRLDRRSGNVGLKIYKAGPVDLVWSVRTSGKCGNHILQDPQTVRIDLLPGTEPQIILQDPFETAEPKKRIRADNGFFDLLVFDKRYEVHEVGTGVKVFEQDGEDPNFSPTGRFVAARPLSDSTYLASYEVFDILTGTLVYTGGDRFIAWARDDSIILAGGGRYAGVDVVPTLTDGREASKFQGLYKFSKLETDVGLVLNLEKGFVVQGPEHLDDITVHIYDLATGETIDIETALTDPLPDVNPELEKRFGGRIEKPLDIWIAGEKLKLSHCQYCHLKDVTGKKPQQVGSWSGAALLKHADITKQPVTAAKLPNSGRALAGRALDGRAIDVVGKEGSTQLVRRLETVGIVLAPTTPPDIGSAPAEPDLSFEDKGYEAEQKKYKSKRDAWEASVKRVLDTLTIRTEGDAKHRIEVAGFAFDTREIWRWRDEKSDIALVHHYYTSGTAQEAFGSFWIADFHTKTLTEMSASHDENTDAALDHGVLENSISDIVASRSADLLLVGSSDTRTAKVLDMTTRKFRTPSHILPAASLLSDLAFTSDGRHFVQINSDGSFYVHKLDADEVVLSGGIVDDEVVVYRKDGLFDSSYEGAHSVQLRFPGLKGVHSFNQFEALLKRPGLAADVLQGRGVPAPAALRGAPPQVSISLDGPATEGRIRVNVEASSTQQLRSVKLFVNGREAESRDVQTLSARETFDIADPGGGRWITAIAIDGDGLISVPSGLPLPGAAQPKGRLFAVTVGVDKYDDKDIRQLAFARSDTARLGEALNATSGKSYSGIDIRSLADAEASSLAVLAAVDAQVAAAGPDDTVLFFFAGHGIADQTLSSFYLVTTQTKYGDIAGTALPWSEIADRLKKSKARVIVLLDACQSGATGNQSRTTNDALAGQLLTGSGAPIVVLAAAKGRELSLEDPSSGGGLFTSALVNVIAKSRNQYDANKNSLLDAGEVYSGVKAQVVKHSTRLEKEDPDKEIKAHTPWLARNAIIGDFAMF